MFHREEFDLEFEEKVTKIFLKTVSAFSNYYDGKIIFGINDDGKIVGIKNIDEERLKIENMINDTLDPIPSYKLEVKDLDGKQIIILGIFKRKCFYIKKSYYSRSIL